MCHYFRSCRTVARVMLKAGMPRVCMEVSVCLSFLGSSLLAESRSCYRDTGLMCVCMQVSVCLTFVVVFLPAGRECSVSPRHRTDVCLYAGVCVSHLSVFSLPAESGACRRNTDLMCVSVCRCPCVSHVCVSHLSCPSCQQPVSRVAGRQACRGRFS